MVIGLREVVCVVECTLVFAGTSDFFNNTASKRGTGVVVWAEVVFSNFEDNWESENASLFVYGVVEIKSTLPSVVESTAISFGEDVAKISGEFGLAVWGTMGSAKSWVPAASSVFAMVGEVTVLMDANGVKSSWPDAFEFSNNLDSLVMISVINAFLFEINMSVDEGLAGIGHVSTSAGSFLFVIC